MTLLNLPDIRLVDDDVTATLNNMVTVFEATAGRHLAPGAPERLFLLSIAQIIVQQRVLINLNGKQALLRYASGTILDHLGAFWETSRLPTTAARVTLRFTLSAPQSALVNVPTGSRVSAAGITPRYFATERALVIQPGQTSGDVAAVCLETGLVGNGYLPGQIQQLVDPIPFIAAVSNVNASAGGADTESDDAYRMRIHAAPESFSVAGPSGAYQYWAKSASAAIVDVTVRSPSPGRVEVVPLLAGGEIPNADVLSSVAAILSDRKVRPLTDNVSVLAPVVKPYAITLTYWIDKARAAEAGVIQAAIADAVAGYALWQKSKLGRDINPSELIHRVMAAGALRVQVTSPMFTAVDETVVAVASGQTVTYGGLSDG